LTVNAKKALYQVPVPSTDFTTEAELCANSVRFGYRKGATECMGGIRFKRVRAIRTRSENACMVWNIEGAYDTLVEIEDSSWVDEIKADTAERRIKLGEKWGMHDYMIYLDSAGCFEFIAESWEALPEERGMWT
jgi:hypothetical protein